MVLILFNLNKLESIIKHIIKSSKVLTICSSVDNTPYCANVFYAFNFNKSELYFISQKDTHHIQMALKNPKIAGTIYLQPRLGKTKGIQFTGLLKTPDELQQKEVKRVYLKRFPFAKAAKIDYWIIELHHIKASVSNMGISKKYFWSKNK